jgi:Carbohydrate esterase, sialic acid-specific acetylesterase
VKLKDKDKVMRSISIIIAIMAICANSKAAEGPSTNSTDSAGKHLFILSGQSNMAKMDHDVSFTPAVEKAFGKGNATVVRNAETGAPLLKWDKDYKWPEDRQIPQGRKKEGKAEKKELATGERYDELMAAVKKHTEGKHYDTVTFVWMQGETDAGKKLVELYFESFDRVVARLKSDLKIESMNIVIGRLSDCAINNPEWVRMRELQVKYAEEHPNCTWVNTDDLNDKKKDDGTVENGLHYTEEGYKILGERFAEKAIGLLKKASPPPSLPVVGREQTRK